MPKCFYDDAFSRLSKSYFMEFLKYSPELATFWGFPRYDYYLDTLEDSRAVAENEGLSRVYKKLQKIDISQLNRSQRLDYTVMNSWVEYTLTNLNIQDNLSSPSDFLPFDDLSILFERNVKRLPEKFLSRLEKIPKRMSNATKLLAENRKSIPPEWVKTAIDYGKGGCLFLEDILKHSRISQSKLRKKIEAAIGDAKQSVMEYLDFLTCKLLPKADGTFAVSRRGMDLVLKKVHFLDFSIDEIYSYGEKLFDTTLSDLKKEFGDNWYSYEAKIKHRRPEKDLLGVYGEYTQKAVRFIEKNNVCPLPKEKINLRVLHDYETNMIPFAAYSSPPFNKRQGGSIFLNLGSSTANEHYFSFIRALVVHEGYPGHHVQLSLANKHAHARSSGWIRLLNESSTMYEGWAVYSEQLMIELGFNNYKSDRFVLLKDRLWRALRVMLDIGLHVYGWSYDYAKRLMINKLKFSEESAMNDLGWYIEYPGVPLGYAVGWQMINFLKEYEQDRLKSKFSNYEFHKKLLSQGSIGLPLVIEESFGKKALDYVNSEFIRRV